MQAITLPSILHPSYWGWSGQQLAQDDYKTLKIVAVASVALLTLSLNFYKVAFGVLAFTFLHTAALICFSSETESPCLTRLKIRRLYQVLSLGFLIAGTALGIGSLSGLAQGTWQVLACWKGHQISWVFLNGFFKISSIIGVVSLVARYLFQAASLCQQYVEFCSKRVMKPLSGGLFTEMERIFSKLRASKFNLDENGSSGFFMGIDLNHHNENKSPF